MGREAFRVGQSHQFSEEAQPACLVHLGQTVKEQAGVGRVRQYQGRVIRRTVTGTMQYDWLVKVFDLPVQADGLRPIVVHSQQSPRSGWSWFDSPPPQQERSLVAWLDQRGEVVQQFLPAGE